MARIRRYSDEQLIQAVGESHSYRNVLRILGIKQAGGSQSHIKRRIDLLGLDISHFTGQAHNRGKTLPPRRYAQNILVRRPGELGREKTHLLHRALQEIGRAYICEGERCNNDGQWRGRPLTLHIDHTDGDWTNNQAPNLRYLCPNCHQQTPNYGSKNKR